MDSQVTGEFVAKLSNDVGFIEMPRLPERPAWLQDPGRTNDLCIEIHLEKFDDTVLHVHNETDLRAVYELLDAAVKLL